MGIDRSVDPARLADLRLAPPAAEVFTVRGYDPATDLAFVKDSWLRSAWGQENQRLKEREGKSARVRRGIGVDWYARHRPLVAAKLESGLIVVWVAVDRTDRDHIGAWLATRNGATHYAYTKEAYRGWGLIKMLAGVAGVPWGRA